MKRLTLTTCAILIMVFTSAITIAQSTETRNLSGFTQVSFGVSGNLNIRIGSEFKVTLEADKDFLAEIETKVSNNRLVITRKDDYRYRRLRSNNNSKVTVNITMPAISGITVSGSGTVEVFDSFKTGSLSLSVSGSGRLILNDVLGEELNCTISGSGGVLVNGNGSFTKSNIRISGSGRYNGESLKSETVNVTISGSGGCICYVTNSLEARVSGSGRVTYLGNPQKIDSTVSGSGRVRPQ